jgi:hypothetical protein
MPTIGRHRPQSSPRGDYPSRCDYCGAAWWRSSLRKDGAGKLKCPDEGDGLDAVTLNAYEAAAATSYGQTQPEVRDGAFNKEDPFGETVHLTTIDPF